MALTADQQRYWADHLGTVPAGHPAHGARVTAGYAGGPEISDGLVDLYRRGVKTAGSGLLADYLAAGDPVPRPGDHWIVLGGDGRPGCLLRTARVERHRFADVPVEVAAAEGEGDRSVAAWRRIHAEHWAPDLAAWGVTDLDAAIVVTEFFEIARR